MAPVQTAVFPVEGMSCASCSASVESMLGHLPGVEKAQVNLALAQVAVTWQPEQVSPPQMKEQLASIGYTLLIPDSEPTPPRRGGGSVSGTQVVWSGALALPVFLLSMIFPGLFPQQNTLLALLTSILVWGLGRSYYQIAWKKALHGQMGMETLVALSTGTAYLFSLAMVLFPDVFHAWGLHHVYFEDVAVVLFFLLLGKWLEEKAKFRAGEAYRALLHLAPTEVERQEGDQWRSIPLEALQMGDVVRVKPGERIAVDGEVLSGFSQIDESPLTGEYLPVTKQTGDKVWAGTLNQQGSLTYRAQKLGKDSLLGRIRQAVEEAQSSKPPIQQWVDRLAARFVPIVLGIALLTALAWTFSGVDDSLPKALQAVLAVLVVACPCAMGLATPTALMVGLTQASRQGLLIRRTEALEKAQKLDRIVFDKTGTLTEGRPEVIGMQGLEAFPDLLPWILAAEERSEHPLSQAICRYLRQQGITPATLDTIEALPGQGLLAFYPGGILGLGNAALMRYLRGEALPLAPQHEAAQVVYVHAQGKTIGYLALQDTPKPEAPSVIAELKAQGITPVLASGDRAEVAQALAQTLGISEVYAPLLPEEKRQLVQNWQQQGQRVGMVGDGINDAPALAQADLSLAMGLGTDLALEVSDMTLVGSDLGKLPKALRVSQMTLQTLRSNLFWAFAYNVLMIPLAAGLLYPLTGYILDPMWAGLAMAFSSVSVVGNSLLLGWRIQNA